MKGAFFPQKLFNLGPVLNKLMHSSVSLGDFCDFAEKIAILGLFQLLFARF